MELCFKLGIVIICLISAVGISSICLIIFGTLKIKRKINVIEVKLHNINQNLENNAKVLISSANDLREIPRLSLCTTCYSLKLSSSNPTEEKR
jgi:hypothetical protein